MPDTETLIHQHVDSLRCDLAASFRLAAQENLHEGIDNHFSCDLGDGTFLINRFGVHWSRMTRSDVLRVDHEGKVVEGSGEVEITAFQIHSAIHRNDSNATVVMHTHQPYATALACCEGESLKPVSQSSLMFYGDVAYEHEFRGLADSDEEGVRLADSINKKSVLFLGNHGVIVVGTSIGKAFHGLYFLERASQLQILAASSGLPMALIPDDIAELTYAQISELDEDKEAYFSAMVRLLKEDQPDYMK